MWRVDVKLSILELAVKNEKFKLQRKPRPIFRKPNTNMSARMSSHNLPSKHSDIHDPVHDTPVLNDVENNRK